MAQEYKTLPEALGAVQVAIKQPEKTAKNPMFKNNYVTLEGVVNVLNVAIKEVEAKIFWANETRDGYMYTVIHGYGDEMHLRGSKVAEDLGNRGTNTAQAEGSALTYARRYSLSMAFGITSDVDDDGNGAPKRAAQAKKQPSKPVQQRQTEPKQSNKGELLKRLDELVNGYTKKTGKSAAETYGELGNFAGVMISEKADLAQLSDQQILVVGKHLNKMTQEA